MSKFIFPHIFKTGGTSMNQFLYLNFNTANINPSVNNFKDFIQFDIIEGHMPYGLHQIINEETIDAIKELNKLDQILYNHILDKQLY